MQNSPPQIVDLTVIERRFFRDASFLNEVLQNYRKTCEKCISDLRQSISSNDHTLQAHAAHKLRGSTLNFSDDKIVETLTAIENGSHPATLTDVDQIETLVRELTESLTRIVQSWSSSQQRIS
jgi:HPt (histidine-containing phosphotransfer) domain-containing protein